MKRLASAAIAVLFIVGVSGVAAAPASSNLEPRVAALEAQVAQLQARVTRLEGLHASPSPTVAPTATPTASPAPTATASPPPSPTPSPTLGPPTPTPSPGACPASLQTAINNAPAGSTLNVQGCTYSGDVTIGKALTLIGGSITGRVLIRASDVTIDRTEVKGSNPGNQQGAIDADNVSRVTLRDVNVHHNAGAGFSITGGTDHLITGGEFHRNRQQGYHLSGVTRALITGVDVHHNNLTSDWPSGAYSARWAVDPYWEAGAGKVARSTFVTFERSFVHENGGPGIWYDIDANDAVIRENKVWANDLSGIFYEISRRALIHDNVSNRNGKLDTRGWAWPADMLISSSRDVEVAFNVIGDGTVGLSVLSQNRGGGYDEMSGIEVFQNDFLGTSGRHVGWHDPDGGTSFADPTVFGHDNRYEGPDGNRYEWNSVTRNLAGHNGTPGEENGRYLTSTEIAGLRNMIP